MEFPGEWCRETWDDSCAVGLESNWPSLKLENKELQEEHFKTKIINYLIYIDIDVYIHDEIYGLPDVFNNNGKGRIKEKYT